MTPEEKAFELTEKYVDQLLDVGKHRSDVLNTSKQCALIAVEEVIHKVQSTQWLEENNQKFDKDYTQEYWMEVKQEISKL